MAVFPDNLTPTPPGLRLTAVLAAMELSAVPNDRMLDLLACQHRNLCHEHARICKPTHPSG